MQASHHQFIYEEIAENIQAAIISGALQPGEKLKSVRMMSHELGVSPATIFRAYYDLESSGMIESRPKSGYYVCYTATEVMLPSMEAYDHQAKDITNVALVNAFLDSAASPAVQLNLGTAVPDPQLLPLGKIKKSIQKSYLSDPNVALAYESAVGSPQLRRRISQFGRSWSKALTEDDVVITNGCLEAISLCLTAVTGPGDVIAIESPAYYGLLQLISNLGLKVVEIPSDPKTGISLDFMEQALQKGTISAMLLTSNFNNPNGSMIPDEHKQTLAGWAAKYRVPILEDDVYGDLYFGSSRPKTCKTYDEDGWVMYCSSFSKTLMPGYRLGWCLPGRFQEQVVYKKSNTNVATSSIVQAITNHFLEFGRYEFHLKKLRQALKVQHQQYKRAIFDHFPGKIPCSNPMGGYVLWLELPSHQNAYELYQKALAKGIRIAPGQIFSARQQLQNYFRMSYGKPFDEQVASGIRQLGELAAQL